MIKPSKLSPGDLVATVSLSWGGAGDPEFSHRYEIGVNRLKELFGLRVIAMPNALRGSEYLEQNPQARAEDLMEAFRNPEIKAIFSNIGGSDTIRLLPYIDFAVIRNNPKIFMGFSDSTTNHLMCVKAGVTSFYGPSILFDIAENVEMHNYTLQSIRNTLFQTEPAGVICSSECWIKETIPWEESSAHIQRKPEQESRGYELIQGKGLVHGRLFGGCLEVLNTLLASDLWLHKTDWETTILFLETCEEFPEPSFVEKFLRHLGNQNILQRISGIIWAKPQAEMFYEEYKLVIRSVIQDEFTLNDLPILYNLNFGHNAPMFILPYGVMAEINCTESSFSILESGVVDEPCTPSIDDKIFF